MTERAVVENAEALEWLKQQQTESAALAVFDPPYSVDSPSKGREAGAGGVVFAPFALFHRSLVEIARVLRPGGVVMMFSDWRRMADIGYIATLAGLRPCSCVAWVRNRPGTGGLFRSSWDPIVIAARGTPSAIDRAAIRNVVVADTDTKRTHPYGKPPELFRHVFPRVCVAGDLVIDPFAGSGASRTVALEFGLRWSGCDINPTWATDESTNA